MIEIQVVDAQTAPGEVDAIIVEDDTFHVLSADPEWRPVAEHPLRVLAAAVRTRPAALGGVTVVEERPLKLCAVIHDLDVEPSCQEPAIARALDAILAIVRQRGLHRLSTPLLGTVHGRLPLPGACTLLCAALAASTATPLHRIELRVASAQLDAVRALLAAPPLH